MGIQERKQKHREDLRQAILEAAEELFIQQGFQNVTMRKIAKQIEYSPTTIYLYFKDKQEIFHCLLEEYYSRLLKTMQDINEKYSDDLLHCIRKGMFAYIHFGLDNPNYYKLAFMLTPPDLPAEGYVDQRFLGNQVQQTLRVNVSECIRRGMFSLTDPELAMQIIWSMNHGITSLLISNPNYPWIEQEKLIEASIEAAIKGMLK